MGTVNTRLGVKMALRKRLIDEISKDLIISISFYGNYLNDVFLGARPDGRAKLHPRFLEGPVQFHQKRFDAMRRLDFSMTDRVRPGAVCRIGKRYCVVAVTVPLFIFDGTRYAGISEHSRMYQCMKSLRAGDSFEHAVKRHTIGEVF